MLDRLQNDQRGFSAIEVLLVIVVIAVIGVAGYFVAKHVDKKTVTPVASTSTTKAVSTTPTNPSPSLYQAVDLADNNVGFSILKSEWEIVPSSASTYFNNQNHNCGQGATTNIQCSDVATLALAKEGFTNPDQFWVSVGVIDNPGTTNAQDWFGTLGEEGTGGSGSNLTINNLSAYRYEINPSPGSGNEEDLYYAIVSNKEAVLVYADLFSGNHASFKTTNNYLGYAGAVDTIAKSVKINN